MMKKFTLSLLALFVATAMQAETALFVHQKTGDVIEISFAEKPVVTYQDGYVVVSAAEASVMCPLAGLQKFTFGEVEENVTRVVAPETATPQPTMIYSIDGKLMRTYQPGEGRATSASLDGLPAGTYVIKNGKTSFKMLKN